MHDGRCRGRIPLFWFCLVPLALSLWSSMSFGLGFGTIKLYSYLNEPLDAEIELIGTDDVNISNLLVALAPAEDFEKVHMARPYFLTKLRFEVVQQGDRTFISVQSDEAIKRAFLEFLVLLHWPEGRLVRSYTLLFDPAPIGRTSRRSESMPKALGNLAVNKSDNPRVTTFNHGNTSLNEKTFNLNTTQALERLFEPDHPGGSEMDHAIQTSKPVSVASTQEEIVEKAKEAAKLMIEQSKVLEVQKHEAEVLKQKEASIAHQFTLLWNPLKSAIKSHKVLWGTSLAVLMLGGVSLFYLRRFRSTLLPLSIQKIGPRKPPPFFDQEFSIRIELAKHYAAIKDLSSARQVLEAMFTYGNQREKQAAQELSDRLSLF